MEWQPFWLDTPDVYASPDAVAARERARAAYEARHAEVWAIESELLELSGQLNAAQYRWLVLLQKFDACSGWAGAGIHSLAHWLNWKCGIDLGAARERVRVARALPGLPRIAAALESGQLSYSKVRALTRVACAATEDYLLQIALQGTASHVERLVRSFRRACEAEELAREQRQQAARSVAWKIDEDGCYVVTARLPAESGALFLRALDAAVEAMPAPHVSAETYYAASTRATTSSTGEAAPTWRARRAEALAAMAETFLQHGFDPLAGGERQQLVVHVDVETLAHSAAGRCECEDGPALAAETVRRLGCDASLVTLLERDGVPLDVGRRTRAIPPAIRRALQARDRGCRFPGCTHERFVDGHHVQHWANGGETKLDNLLLLCRFHHRLVHEGGFDVQRLDDGAYRFLDPDGRAIPSAPTSMTDGAPPVDGRTAADRLRDAHAASGLSIDADTVVPGWCGERMDYGLGVQVLLEQRARGKLPGAGGSAGAGLQP